MSLALSLGICSPVNAISMQDEILTDNLESMMQVLEKETTNEYDYIVEIRDAKKNAKAIANVSEEEVEYITSDAIESELLYRSTLPTEVLKDQYCYSDEAIDVLRDYNGEKLEENPELRAVTATLSAALGELVKSDTRMGVIYTWSWDSKPLVLFTDYAAMSWEGTYTNGKTNNMALDLRTSFSTVNYYYPPITKSVTPYSVMNYSIDFASGALKVSELTLCPIKKQVFPMLTPFSVTDLPFSSSSLPDDRGRYSPLIQYRLFQRKTPVHRR